MTELKVLQKVSENLGCEGCEFRKLFPDNNFVSPQETTSKRLAVGEAPGCEEAEKGKPFVGGAGTWLEFLYRKASVKKDTVNITNVLCCRPPNNVFPTDPEARSYISKEKGELVVQHCLKNHVWPFIKSKQWQRIDLLGGKALEYIARKKEGIQKWRGSPLVIPELGNTPIAIPTMHPAAIARDQSIIPAVINDLRKGLTPPPEYYNLYPSLAEVQAFNSTEFAADIETAYGWGDARRVTMVGLSDKLYHAMVIPFEGVYKAELKRIFGNCKTLITQNGLQFDGPILEENGIKFHEDLEHVDIMLCHHLRFPDLPHDLEFIGSCFSNKPAWKHEKSSMELYNARDVDVTFQAYKQLRPMLQQAKLWDLYRYIQVPLAKICYEMSSLGVKIDSSRIGEVRQEVEGKIQEEEKFLPEKLRTQTIVKKKRELNTIGALGKNGKLLKYISIDVEEQEIPWASSKKIGEYLYGELGLPEQADLKTGKVSTGKIALEKLYNKTKNRAIKAIKNLRKLNSMLTLFAKESMAKATTIHTHFNVHGTGSGRLSSSDPNLQNQPESARYLYVPRHAGWVLCEADFSQIENRLTAWFANDTDRLGRFLADLKFSEHKWAASLIFDLEMDSIEKDNDKDAPYGRGKRINHGTGYLMGAKKISLMYDLPFAEVKIQQDRLKAAMPKTTEWQQATCRQIKADGQLTNPFSRTRWLYTSSAATEGVAFLPQSTAADIMFRSMLGFMYERIKWPESLARKVVPYIEPLPKPANLLLTVHDSVLIETPQDLLPQVIGVLTRVMTQPWPELGGFSIPVSVAVGCSWGETEEYDGAII